MLDFKYLTIPTAYLALVLKGLLEGDTSDGWIRIFVLRVASTRVHVHVRTRNTGAAPGGTSLFADNMDLSLRKAVSCCGSCIADSVSYCFSLSLFTRVSGKKSSHLHVDAVQ